ERSASVLKCWWARRQVPQGLRDAPPIERWRHPSHHRTGQSVTAKSLPPLRHGQPSSPLPRRQGERLTSASRALVSIERLPTAEGIWKCLEATGHSCLVVAVVESPAAANTGVGGIPSPRLRSRTSLRKRVTNITAPPTPPATRKAWLRLTPSFCGAAGDRWAPLPPLAEWVTMAPSTAVPTSDPIARR